MQFLAQSVFLKALGWSLANSVWQMGLLWIAYQLLTSNSRKFSASIRHSIAVVLIHAGILWFVFSVLYSWIHFKPNTNIFAGIMLYEHGNPVLMLKFLTTLVNNLLPYGACFYLLFFAFHLFKYFGNYIDAQKFLQDGLFKLDAHYRLFVEEISLRLGILKKVEVFLSTVADSPMTIGFFRYIIVIPLATVNHLTTEQVEAILLHELAHIKRNDYFVNLVITAMETVLFFNPFARLFIRLIKNERENSCDDVVLQFKYAPKTYVTALLSLEKSRHGHHPMVLAAGGRDNKLLLQRIRRITGQKNRRPRLKTSYALLLMMTVVFACIMRMQFKVIPSVVHTVVTHPREKNTHAEGEMGHFVRTFFAVPPEKRNLQPSDRKERKIDEDTGDGGTLQSEDEQTTEAIVDHSDDQPTMDDNLISTDQSEPVDYSIQPSSADMTSPSAPNPGSYPYIPKNSFNFQIQPDSLVGMDVIATPAQLDSSETLVKYLEVLQAADLAKIRQQLSQCNGAYREMAVLANLLKRPLRAAVGKKTSMSSCDNSSTKLLRINSDIQIQLDALSTVEARNDTRAKRLNDEILHNRLKLQQTYLQKQQQILKAIDSAKRKLKIVEI